MEHLNVKTVIFLVVCLIVGWCIMVVFGVKKSRKQMLEHKQHTEEIYGNIQFKGKVLRIHQIKRGGRNCGIMCVRLDYTNIDSFYRFDDMSCLKIKNSILTLPTGSLAIEDDERVLAILNADYIEININNSRQMVFIDSIGNKFARDYLYYRSSNLIERDMELCDDCK